MSNTRQGFFRHVESVAAALSVTLDGVDWPLTRVEVWIECDQAATFSIYGSGDGVNFRKTGEIVFAGAGEQAQGFNNAWRYVKVSTATAVTAAIELAGGRG